MLERLFASIASGPALNCRPHNSRQRIDWSALARLKDTDPAAALRALLSAEGACTVRALVPPPPARTPPRQRSGDKNGAAAPPDNTTSTPPAPDTTQAAEPAAPPDPAEPQSRAFSEQQALLTKLRVLVDEARTYEDDTGVHVLHVGYPLLSIPPGQGPRQGTGSRRVLAPIAFVPVEVKVGAGAGASVRIECKEEEVDRIVPNEALLAWIEQQTGKRRPELFADEDGADPWREITSIVAHICSALSIPVPEGFTPPFAPPVFPQSAPAFPPPPTPNPTPAPTPTPTPSTTQDPPRDDDASLEAAPPSAPQPLTLPPTLPLIAAPESDDLAGDMRIIPCAVMGLFPVSNQGLLRDTKELSEGAPFRGPVEHFVRAGVSFDAAPAQQGESAPQSPAAPRRRDHASDRLVAPADPCQARAVALARTSKGLVVHGPPGTGKSQTITNIIGDHLSRGERVLFVCEKRTALDVVYNRLETLGLGSLCAVIHDPAREQRELYMSIRDQVDRLTEEGLHPRAAAEIEKIDAELNAIHAELTALHQGLMHDGPDGRSLHELLGLWISLRTTDAPALTGGGTPPALADIAPRETSLRELFRRAIDVEFARNPWAAAAGMPLSAFLSRPLDGHRRPLAALVEAAEKADAASRDTVPPFGPDVDLPAQTAARERLLPLLRSALAAPQPVRTLWAARTAQECEKAAALLAPAVAAAENCRGPLDPELAASVSAPPPVSELARRISALEAYRQSAAGFLHFLAFGKKSAAREALAPLGLSISPDHAARAAAFYGQLRSRLVVSSVVSQIEGSGPGLGQPPRDDAADAFFAHSAVLAALRACDSDPALAPLSPRLREALRAGPGAEPATALEEGLARSRARAEALAALEECARAGGMLAADWLRRSAGVWRAGDAARPVCDDLASRLHQLEDVLRTREGLAALPPALRDACAGLVRAAAEPDAALASLWCAAAEAEIGARLSASPPLRELDPRRVQTLIDRARELSERKRELAVRAVRHLWLTRQRERLVASTGNRLSPQGADVKRRLLTRGSRAMRLRRVLEMGRAIEGGDPLFLLRPVWMASPETVAQLFPRDEVFDVVVFDEASQCRLEEALPVLTRGRRVVIAGDPKQLPPTRFFESAFGSSEAPEIESDQDLFEAQQSSIEDLLAAALSLDVDQCYLDVHYRSRNSELIEFSNRHFYGSRLQPLPGHPSNRAPAAPMSLHHAGGVYEKRRNEAEAAHVVRIVRDLLLSPRPPSIGVGCFNIAQRDLIVEKLEEAAAEDPAFAKALGEARQRRGKGSFEGLFVKNLENVQGDERDHIIISTTYGPDRAGRFYRRFGPLAMPGGGRRLNVLVTRARERVHLVTSVPRDAYAAVPPVPDGMTPSGGWLLMEYLRHAEMVTALYDSSEKNTQADASADPSAAEFIESETRTPSVVALALGERLMLKHGAGSIAHWGNEGFCIDLALRHPRSPSAVTIGVLCDTCRYTGAEDPVEWDLFRTGILTGLGWNIERLWSPVLFRDLAGCEQRVLDKAALAAAQAPPVRAG